jgi:uncharacterized membrane protein
MFRGKVNNSYEISRYNFRVRSTTLVTLLSILCFLLVSEMEHALAVTGKSLIAKGNV